MRILVTGASGMLGRDVTAAAEAAGHAVLGLTRADLDVTDWTAVRSAVVGSRPDAVVNCAAYTDVDGAEEDPETATAVNGTGAGHVAAAAAQAGALIVHVSSDYVFDGRQTRPYVESDDPDPLSVYGHSKLSGEHAVRESNPRHVIVRSSWLFGIGGPNFVETMLRLGSERDEVTVVADQVGCPTWTAHLAPTLVSLGERGLWGVHHVAGGGWCSWCEFAQEIFRQAGVACRACPVTSADFPRPAARPRFSVLGTERPEAVPLPVWERALAGYLALREASVR